MLTRVIALLFMLVLLVPSAIVMVPTAKADDPCPQCPKTGDCPKSSAQNTTCPCPKTGDCPKNIIVGPLSVLEQLNRNGQLFDLSSVSSVSSAQQHLPAPLRLDSGNGGNAIVPLGVYTNNRLWVSTRALQQMGWTGTIDLGKLDDFVTRAKQYGLAPVEIGSEAWSVGLTFETLLLAKGGPSIFKALIVDHDQNQKQPVADALTLLKSLGTTNGTGPSTDTESALYAVAKGKAVMTIAPDWALSTFNEVGAKPQGDYTCARVPGTEGSIIYTPGPYAAVDSGSNDDPSAAASHLVDPTFLSAFAIANTLTPLVGSQDPFAACAGSEQEPSQISAGNLIAVPEGAAGRLFQDAALEALSGSDTPDTIAGKLVSDLAALQ